MNNNSLCDERVFGKLYEEKCESLRNFIYYKCGDIEKAEDLMQEAFVKVWKKCAEVIMSTVSGLLFRIANNLFLDHVREQQVVLKFQKTVSLNQHQDTEDPYFQLRSIEFQNQIEQEISQLPDGQRTAFLMNRIDKMTYKEIAQNLDISETAVEKRISKALAKLKVRIQELKKI